MGARCASLVSGDAVGNPGSPELESEYCLLKASSGHRWCQYSSMTPDEVLVFRQADTVTEGVSGGPHVSFVERANADASPRLSMPLES